MIAIGIEWLNKSFNFFRSLSKKSFDAETPKADSGAEETDGDLLPTSFEFPDFDFGSKTERKSVPNPDPPKPDNPAKSGRGFPPDVPEAKDSESDESRNNFFANPFSFSNPIFAGSGFSGQSAAGSSQQESLSQGADFCESPFRPKSFRTNFCSPNFVKDFFRKIQIYRKLQILTPKNCPKSFRTNFYPRIFKKISSKNYGLIYIYLTILGLN
jgi:hypothetical protein